ncbi:MAG: TonB-dependent receptor [Halioglobus sp.]
MSQLFSRAMKFLPAVTLLVLVANGARAERALLEEVLVTAQKRVENVQDIPITINVVTGDVLDGFRIRNTNDLADSVPGLTIQHTPQNLAQVAIRGLGTGSAGESLDQSVGLFIDGVWAGRIREFQASLFDIERVEVIKGTQTTLLGKNTSVGAVSVVSRRPGDELGGYLQGDYEFEFDSTYLTGALDIPTDLGNYRIAFNDVSEKGYVSNDSTGNEVPHREQSTLRIGGEWSVTDNGRLLLSYQYDDLEILGDTFQPDNDELGFLAGMDPDADIGIDQSKNADTSVGRSGDAEDEQESQRAIIHYEHSFGDYQFTSLTGWSEYENERVVDTDFMSVDYLSTAFTSDYEQISQEFRVASPTDRRIEYVVGLFYLDGEMGFSGLTDTRFPPPYTAGPFPLDSTSVRYYDQETTVWSLFGQSTVSISDRWRATLGLRYTDESKDAVWERVRLRSGGVLADIVSDVLAPEVPATPLDRSEDNLDGSVNVQYDFSDDTMFFVSWATGSKSGGFSTEVATPDEAEFETEEAETTELGVKMSLAGGAAFLNAALFYTEIENFQVATFVGTGFEVFTVPAESQGLEFESRWLVSQRLTLGATATYADATEQDSGMQLPYAPEWSASLNALYEIPLQGDLVWRIGAVVNYRDEQYMQAGERDLDDALTLLDMRLALASAVNTWELALVGRNLLDEESSFGFDFPFFGGQGDLPVGAATIGSLSRPRTLALQARYNF